MTTSNVHYNDCVGNESICTVYNNFPERSEAKIFQDDFIFMTFAYLLNSPDHFYKLLRMNIPPYPPKA